MESEHAPGEFLVALIDGALVGAARLEWKEQAAYLRQVSVAAAWQRQGAGRALVRALAGGLPQLSVVSRGASVGFYRRLGFVPLPWEQVPPDYREECAACPIYAECQPLPMVLAAGSPVVES